ncbi:BamA/TamA family outer membrane protein [Sungkyunkwania multivorans]|uniref:BamA/TamA family outer membrane protein n=1 Tax=Sungkyunkwania multivorans TaxID=1173618 RepID=A0ABW3CSN5_9FLAO
MYEKLSFTIFKTALFTILGILLLNTERGLAQELRLMIFPENAKDTTLVDSVGYLKTFEDYVAMTKELSRFSDKLSKIGYFENYFYPPTFSNDSIFISNIVLGERKTHINVILPSGPERRLIKGSRFVTSDTVKLKIREYQKLIDQLLYDLEKRGNIFDVIQLKNIKIEDNEVYGDLTIDLKTPRSIDDIIIKGYDKFPFSFIKYTSKLKSGKPLDREMIENESNSLNTLPFINQLKPPEILFEKDSSTVFLYFEKTKSNYFDGFIGFSNDDTTNNIQLNGYVDLRLVNNLDRGEQLNILWKNDGNEQTRFRALLDLPFIFKSPLGVGASLDIFRKDSTFLNTEVKLKLNYQLSPRGRVSLGITQYESNDLLDNSLMSVDDLEATKINLGYTYILPNLDDALFRNKATVFLETNFGNRDSDLGGETQYSIELNANYLWKINFRNRIFINNATSFLNSNNYFDNEKFRLGGINSIRGFNENSLEATFFSYLNTEYRFLLSSNTYINSIFDVGYLQDDLLKTKNNLLGFGLGLGINSNAGLFRLNYALGKSNDSRLKFTDAKVHISFSSIF